MNLVSVCRRGAGIPGGARITLALLLAGCASYEPRPLVPEDELAQLRAASIEAVRLERAAPADADGGLPASAEAAAHPRVPADFDPSDGLDEAELVAVALHLNPELRAQRAQLGVARALLVSAGLWPDPELGFAVRPGIDGADRTGISADLLFALLRPDERAAREGVAQAGLEVTRADVEAAELQLGVDVRRARVAVLAADQAVRLLQQEAALRVEALALLRRQRELGEATELSVLVADLERARGEREERDARAALDGHRRALNRLAGLPPDLEVPLQGAGEPLTVTLLDDPDDETLDRRLLAGSPALRARAAAYERAEQELRLAVAGQYPALAVGPSYEKDVEGAESFGVGATIGLPLFDRNQGAIAARTAERDQARAQYAALLHALRAQAFAARAELRRARTELDLQERDLSPLVARTEALFEGARRAGELTIFDWLAARSRTVQARRDLLEAATRYADAALELEAALGGAPATPAVHAGRQGGSP